MNASSLTFALCLALGTAGLASTGCGGTDVRVTTADAKAGAVAQHKTFAQQPAALAPKGYTAGDLTPAVYAGVAREVDTALRSKGYTPTGAQDAELEIRVSAGTRIVEAPPQGAATRFGAPSEPDRERGLVIDIFERSTGKALFHGYARYDSAPGEVDAKSLNKAVTEILEPVPPSRP